MSIGVILPVAALSRKSAPSIIARIRRVCKYLGLFGRLYAAMNPYKKVPLIMSLPDSIGQCSRDPELP
jgi:hypothetical protein